jgi:hypothetical protein
VQKYILNTLVIISFLFSNHSSAELAINAFHNNEWKREWTQAIYSELSREENQEMLHRKIFEADLKNLNCPNYNDATEMEKKDFWVVFFSSLARSESGLNELAKSRMSRGHRSYGLLQFAPDTAFRFCQLILLDEQILDGEDNLTCGVKLLNWQMAGAPDKSGRKARADLENKIFGKKMLLWGPLRQNDKSGRKRLYQWFNAHLDQLPFCNDDLDL